MTPDIVIVPHTHWDREWYLPFQRFRLGLVRMLDEVLDTMAADPGYRFTMDGQLAALEDYLEIRPERLGEVRGLVAEGRFAAGPWLILADEFLCAGETLIRNLEYGMRGAAGLGGFMRVGYLPDQFGHCAQMPQILRQAGLEHACVWRGVPASVDRDAFAWVGADGTAIRTQYLPGGYGNAVALFSGPAEALTDRLAAFTETLRPWHPTGPLLAMYGADHSAPAADITTAGLRVATLHDYVTAADPAVAGLPAVHGELRSHARANILPGVISARMPAKQAMARAERIVTRYAEPLSALWTPGSTAAARLLDMAWRRLIACSGHDSITGCGADETAQQVAARIAEAEQIGQAVVDMVSASLAGQAARDALVVVNPSPFPRTALVLADLPESRAALLAPDGGQVPAQRLELAPTLLDETVMDDLTQLLGRIHERELFGQEILSWSAAEDVFTVVVGRHATTGYDYADLRSAVLGHAAARPGPWRVRTCAEPVVTVAAQVTVAPLGRTVLTSAPAPAPVPPSPGWARPDAGTLDNGLLRVTVAADGTLSLFSAGAEAHGVGRVVDGGDAGDTYNHAPPRDDVLVDAPVRVEVDGVCTGPLVSVLEIHREYAWPVCSTPDARSEATERVTVTTRAELRAGEPYLRLETSFDNHCRDHRVRWHAPLPRPAAESFSEGQLSVVRRGLTAEGGCGEHPLPTFPAEGFVTAGGLAVLLDQVTEYELTGGDLALTLIRSVGLLSSNRNAYRDEPAGPQLPTPAAQCPGPVTMRFAVLPHHGAWHEAALPRLAEEYRHALLAVPGSGRGPAAPGAEGSGGSSAGAAGLGVSSAGAGGPGVSSAGATGPGASSAGVGASVEVEGAGVVLAALRERDGELEIRLVAEHPAATEAVIRGPFGAARRADLRGTAGERLEVTGGAVRLPLRPFEIATVHLTRAG
ncbi:alpha-mannosidase [Streptosporangium sp. NBC_01639]|uniref:glycoside hydrolase family 38 N-terminal domain-containing protein n=1 Tax=Streptosporangium sp. NBC_01639 TaxID=2975948 RepID=UPI0038692C35|nr:alpha-mannosidase [Streptosporangium sp. NBC_01639]